MGGNQIRPTVNCKHLKVSTYLIVIHTWVITQTGNRAQFGQGIVVIHSDWFTIEETKSKTMAWVILTPNNKSPVPYIWYWLDIFTIILIR